MKRYTVTSTQTARGPEYVIHDNLTGADVVHCDCERWAETRAKELEEQDKEGEKSGMFKKFIG